VEQLGRLPDAFGNYKVLKHLGRGTYGDTYLVESAGGDLCALKWMRPDPAEGGALRFENEVWALKRLNNPSIPRFIAEGQYQGLPYIVMSFARGVTCRAIHRQLLKEGGVVSQLKAMLIAEGVLDALSHMHASGICHRDVKDDNVIVSDTGAEVTLIDLGVCKGPNQPVDPGTFWGAGAPRFSPPSKLEHPTAAEPTHDVFAVGVLSYLLLTNLYPWTVGKEDDRGDLEKLMRAQRPPAIRQHNPFVDQEVSTFFGRLIDIDDHRRPTSVEALEQLRALRESLEKKIAAPAITFSNIIHLPKVIRDPLHGDIPLTVFERDIIDTREFQRLRRMRQLGFSDLVYHGAVHTRFSHAIGTMYVADKMLNRIQQRTGARFDNDERLTVRAYALIHDVSHIAFGHTLEDETSIFQRHDANTGRIARLILNQEGELCNVLQKTEYGRAVLEYRRNEPLIAPVNQYSWIEEVVDSPTGADVLDYIDRDSLHCGLEHRVDSAIYRWFVIQNAPGTHPEKRHLMTKLRGRKGLRLDAEFARLSVLRERYALFLKVYCHPAKISAGAMLAKAIHSVFSSRRSRLDEQAIEWMGDEELLIRLRETKNKIAPMIVDLLRSRELYDPVFRSRALNSEDSRSIETTYEHRKRQWASAGLFNPDQRAVIENALALDASLEAGQVILYCPSVAPGAQRVRQYVQTEVGLEIRDEIHGPHEEMYRNHLGLWEVYVFVHPSASDRQKRVVAEGAGDKLGLSNQIRQDRRQSRFDF